MMLILLLLSVHNNESDSVSDCVSSTLIVEADCQPALLSTIGSGQAYECQQGQWVVFKAFVCFGRYQYATGVTGPLLWLQIIL